MKSNAKSDLDFCIDRARLSGAMHSYTPEEFKNYLLEIDLNRYEKSILPVEKEGKYSIREPDQGARIIPFLGVSLEPLVHGDHFMEMFDGFLKEMGYIDE